MPLYVAGIDENGLGPKLGPLVVTGSLFRIEEDRYRPEAFQRAFAPAGAGRGAEVADSKAVMGAGSMARGETTVLAFAALLAGRVPGSAREFLDAVLEPGEAKLLGACPPEAAPMCSGEGEGFPFFGGDLEAAEGLASALRVSMAEAGLRLEAVRSETLCPARLNALFAGGAGKADVDLAAFERRIASFSEAAGDGGLYLCGKVMNLKFYTPRMALVSRHPLLRRDETREESRYALQGLGEVRFLLDGDARHLPISLASMFGKVVREVWMARLNRFFGRVLTGIAPATGYGDAATKDLIRRAVPYCRAAGIPGTCLLRDR